MKMVEEKNTNIARKLWRSKQRTEWLVIYFKQNKELFKVKWIHYKLAIFLELNYGL